MTTYDARVRTSYEMEARDEFPLGRVFVITGPGGYRRLIGGRGAKARAEQLLAELNAKLAPEEARP